MYCGAIFFALLAMLTKEIAFTLPLSIFLIEISFFIPEAFKPLICSLKSQYIYTWNGRINWQCIDIHSISNGQFKTDLCKR